MYIDIFTYLYVHPYIYIHTFSQTHTPTFLHMHHIHSGSLRERGRSPSDSPPRKSDVKKTDIDDKSPPRKSDAKKTDVSDKKVHFFERARSQAFCRSVGVKFVIVVLWIRS